MKAQNNRSLITLTLLCLTLGLSCCGQKGGLSRPEPAALTSSNFVSGK